jgi:hypothetical protein
MERVTRGRMRRVQLQQQRRACCAVRCACRASACIRCVFDACCRKRVLVLRCVATHRNGNGLHQAHGVHSCVHAAIAAHVAGGLDNSKSAENGDGVSVVCHLVANADGVNKRDRL